MTATKTIYPKKYDSNVGSTAMNAITITATITITSMLQKLTTRLRAL